MTINRIAGIFLAMMAMLALAACGGGGSEYMLPTGQDYSLRLVKGGDPNDVLASTERKGHITMNVGETLNVTSIYRFRSAIGDKEKDEFVTATSAYVWLEDVNDKLTYSNGKITAVKAGLDTLLVNYVDNNANETVSCRLEITVN
ncbi:hypothetical protein KDL29_03095 [bacterium]|nr:hypothetical protein [bacterium]